MDFHPYQIFQDMCGENIMVRKDSKVIVALDFNDISSAIEMVKSIGDSIEWYKIGSVLYTKEGPDCVRKIKSLGKKIFLDLKFYDIPNTVAGSVKSCVELGVDMFTLHASGGSKMISLAVKTSAEYASKLGVEVPKAIAVTMLTSFSEEAIKNDFGITDSSEEIVKRLASVVVNAGGEGLVASACELPMIRSTFGHDITVITPGVRPSWATAGDQQRVMTPSKAVALGADFLVIGRPIIASDNPVVAAQKILDEIKEG